MAARDITAMTDRQRTVVLDAAVSEVAAKGFGGFSLEGVASRSGVDVPAIQQLWPNSPELLSAALMEFGAQRLPIPDTGSFYRDLLDYAKSFAAMVDSPLGRRLLDAVIAKPRDWDLSGSRPAFLEKRDLRMGAIVRRGVERGECLPDTDPARLIDLIGLGVCVPILLYDRHVTEQDCVFVVDTVFNGIKRR